jgi:anti-sigma factor RsiW
MCTNEQIQMLLPDHLEGTLSRGDNAKVEQHLAVCPDCTAELAVLRLMASETVPDPGEGFWAAMPDQVYRRVQRQKQREGDSWLSGLIRGVFPARWGWAPAMIAVIALLSWVALRPLPHLPPDANAKRGTLQSVDIIEEATNNANVSQADLDRLSAWAHQELLSLQNGLPESSDRTIGALLTGLGADLEEELASLSEEQLETLIDILIDNVDPEHEEA